ncbi:MAG: hypothetical protein ABL952_16660 [Pyrinomonadaceae bacterium]
MTDIAEKIRNYPANARVIVTWHKNGRWSEDSFPVSELKRLAEPQNLIVGASYEFDTIDDLLELPPRSIIETTIT